MGRTWVHERQRKEGRWHLGAQSPERQDAGMGQGLCLVAPVLGLLQSWPLPGVKSCLSDHDRGNVGKGGVVERRAGASGQTGTYTTDVCSEKYRKIVMQI